MSTAQLIALGVSIILALIATVWKMLHIQLHRMEKTSSEAVVAVKAELAKLEGRFEQRAKDRDEFDYQWRHTEYTNAITSINVKLYPLATQMIAVEKNLDGLREWKHVTVDPYIPGAVDAIKEQVDRLTRKADER